MFAVGMWYKTGEQLKFMAEKCSFFRQQRAAVLFQWFIMGYKKHGNSPRFICLIQSHYCFPLFSFLWLYADHRYTAGVSAVPPPPVMWVLSRALITQFLMSKHNPFPSVLIWKALKLWLTAPFVFLLPVCASVGELEYLPPWRSDFNISSARTDHLIISTLYTDVSLCRNPPLAKLRHVNGMCVCFAVKGQFVYIWIYQYTYFLKHFCMFQSCFLMCVYHGGLRCCTRALQAYATRGTMLYILSFFFSCFLFHSFSLSRL